MNMMTYRCLQHIAKQWGVDPNLDFNGLTRELLKLSEQNKWAWQPPKTN